MVDAMPDSVQLACCPLYLHFIFLVLTLIPLMAKLLLLFCNLLFHLYGLIEKGSVIKLPLRLVKSAQQSDGSY